MEACEEVKTSIHPTWRKLFNLIEIMEPPTWWGPRGRGRWETPWVTGNEAILALSLLARSVLMTPCLQKVWLRWYSRLFCSWCFGSTNSLLIAVGVQMILWNGSELTRLSFLLYWSTDTSRHSLVAVSCLHQRIHVISAIIWFGVYSFCIKNQHGHLQLFLL